MKARIITGVIAGGIALAAIILGGYFFAAVLLIAAAVSVIELHVAFKKGGRNPAISSSVILFLALGLGVFSNTTGPGMVVFTSNEYNFFPLILIISVIVSASVFVFDHRNRKFEDISHPFFATLYVVLLLWCGLTLRSMPEGIHLIIMTLVGSIMSDTCAFAFGKMFGKKKLCPDISPKKTFAGMYAGFAGGAVSVVIYGLVLFLLKIDVGIPLWFTPVLGALVSFVSQVGDLFMSAIKRQCGIKDFGKILPGHGGMLDRIDSYLPSFAVTFFAVTLFDLFTV